MFLSIKYSTVSHYSSIGNNFVQSAVDARRQGDENPNSSVVAESMKLLANSSFGYQIMDRSRHTVKVSDRWRNTQCNQ